MKRMKIMIFVLGIVLSAQTARADWGATRRLTWTADASDTPAVAVGSTGSVHVAWTDYTPGNPEIYYKKSGDGGATWGPNKRLTWTSGDSFAPAIGIDSGGGVHILWYDSTPGNYEIFYKRSPDGGATWGSVQRLTSTTGDSRFPVMAIDPGDDIHIGWSDDTPGNPDIYYRRSTNGGSGWGAVQRLTWTAGNSQTPALAAGSASDVHVAWIDDTPGNPELHYRRSTDGGAAWDAVQRLSSTAGKSYSPALAMNSINAVYVFWEDDTPGNYELHYRRSPDAGATWNAAQRLTWTSGDSFSPAAAMTSGNNLHVVWSDYSAGNPDLYSRVRPAGSSTWSAVQRLTWTPEDSAAPAMAVDSSGNIHVFWSDFSPGNYEIYYKIGN
jgi:hypothetical protein